MSKSRSFTKVVALVLGIILIVLGVIVIINAFIIMPTSMAVSTSAVISGSTTLSGATNESALVMTTAVPAKVTVMVSNAYFKVAIVPVTSLPSQGSGEVYWINVSEVPSARFTGNYTSFATELGPGYALIIWPYKVYSQYVSFYYTEQTIPERSQGVSTLATLPILMPSLAFGVVLIIGGIILYRWSNE